MTAARGLSGQLLHRPARALAALGIAIGYAALYLWLSGDLAGGGSGVEARFPAWPRLLEARSPWQFEPVGWISLGTLVWTFSPLNALVGLVLGGLVGLNATAAWLTWQAPRRCRAPAARAGLLAALPALLAGGACCGPLLVIWLGVPVAGVLAGLAPWLVPASALLLTAGLWVQARTLASAAGDSWR